VCWCLGLDVAPLRYASFRQNVAKQYYISYSVTFGSCSSSPAPAFGGRQSNACRDWAREGRYIEGYHRAKRGGTQVHPCGENVAVSQRTRERATRAVATKECRRSFLAGARPRTHTGSVPEELPMAARATEPRLLTQHLPLCHALSTEAEILTTAGVHSRLRSRLCVSHPLTWTA